MTNANLLYQHLALQWVTRVIICLLLRRGCDTKNAYLHHGSKPIIDCLVEAGSSHERKRGSWVTWAFLPVTDGKFIHSFRSKQLAQGNINGLNQFSGQYALEGAAFVQWNTTTFSDRKQLSDTILPPLRNNLSHL